MPQTSAGMPRPGSTGRPRGQTTAPRVAHDMANQTRCEAQQRLRGSPTPAEPVCLRRARAELVGTPIKSAKLRTANPLTTASTPGRDGSCARRPEEGSTAERAARSIPSENRSDRIGLATEVAGQVPVPQPMSSTTEPGESCNILMSAAPQGPARSHQEIDKS